VLPALLALLTCAPIAAARAAHLCSDCCCAVANVDLRAGMPPWSSASSVPASLQIPVDSVVEVNVGVIAAGLGPICQVPAEFLRNPIPSISATGLEAALGGTPFPCTLTWDTAGGVSGQRFAMQVGGVQGGLHQQAAPAQPATCACPGWLF